MKCHNLIFLKRFSLSTNLYFVNSSDFRAEPFFFKLQTCAQFLGHPVDQNNCWVVGKSLKGGIDITHVKDCPVDKSGKFLYQQVYVIK